MQLKTEDLEIMKNIYIVTLALSIAIIHNLSAQVRAVAFDYTDCNWNSYFEHPNKHSYLSAEDIYARIKAQ